ncbi:hypothetical protein ANCDUO_02468 [Ancylostoma duodenale]|uniref:Uncharacterized protein n=1 Tax=Ancylostoma duodenale TaxID=51022 RepID=A0A0C2HCC7_9BILA|nr:hypothetical protein ANCDUO_02468 [Ancylostoma duodenale]
MLGITCLTQVRARIRSSTLREQSKIRDAAAYAKLSKIRWAGHVIRLKTTVGQEPSATGLRGTLGARQEDHRPDRQTSSRSPSRKDIMLFVSLERTESTGQLWLARGTNGRIAGARSVHPKTNGSQGDQGVWKRLQLKRTWSRPAVPL